MEAYLTKTMAGLIPASPQDTETLNTVKIGETIKVKFTKPRNYQFHKKMMALFNLGFDQWEPLTDGAEKNFDRFRKDITIKAGYYEQSVRIDGSIRTEAKSLSYGKMEPDEFEQLYNKVVNVLIKLVLTNYSREDVDNAINQIMDFT